MDGDPIYEWVRSLVDLVTRLVEENPVGWIKSMRKGDRKLLTYRDEISFDLATYLKMKYPRVG